MKESNISRRSFLKTSALAGAAGVIGTGSAASILTSCNNAGDSKTAGGNQPLREPGSYYVPELPDFATDGKELKAGIIGCGGRGSGAAFNFLNAANGVTVTALGDVFKEQVDNLAAKLKAEKNVDIPETMRFVGFDAYKQVIDSGVDVVIIATPTCFRPLHFQYATEQGKHSFLEKPVCVDPVGYRSIMATAKQALAKNLCVITGTQRHHQRSYVESFKLLMSGIIGEVTGGLVSWCEGKLWHRDRQPGWGDGEWMIKDWVNWKWLSGDHIVEQHVHNIDVFTWFTGLKPVSAFGVGSRQRRVTGDQYDNFSVDFTMENGIHVHSISRQIDGCGNNVSEFIQGTKGSWWGTQGRDAVFKDLKGNVLWSWDKEKEDTDFKQTDPYTLEHVCWINHIRSNQPIDEASGTALSNLMAIMGRESAYTGKEVTWDEMSASTLDWTPADVNLQKMDMSGFTVPVPGVAYVPEKK